MRFVTLALLTVSALGLSKAALADNPLSADQLVKATQAALAASASSDPDMANSISGFRVATVGANAQVTIDMKADGMNMSSKYLCVAQGAGMACRQQQ